MKHPRLQKGSDKWGRLQHDARRHLEGTLRLTRPKKLCDGCGKIVDIVFWHPNYSEDEDTPESERKKLCHGCTAVAKGVEPMAVPQIMQKPDVSGYQPGLAEYPGDPNAFVSGEAELDRKVAEAGKREVDWKSPSPSVQ